MEYSWSNTNDAEYFQATFEVLNNRILLVLCKETIILFIKPKHDGVCRYKKAGIDSSL